ncbi:MAG TPA: helix-turn-helix domain-containing protein [Phytomonospora sp.]
MPETRKQTAGAGAPQDPWMSVGKAALELGISPHTVKTRALEGALESTTVGGRIFVSRASVAALKAARQSAAAERAAVAV